MYKNYPSYMLFKKKKIQEGKRIKRKNNCLEVVSIFHRIQQVETQVLIQEKVNKVFLTRSR